ncbi:MAG: S8 family peptidase, partial [Gaiellaceae bacterium]
MLDPNPHRRRPLWTLLPAALAAAILAVALGGAASATPLGTSSAPDARLAVTGEIIVAFKPNVSATAQNELLGRVDAKRKRRFDRIHGALVSVAPGKVGQTIRSLERDRRVAYAEPNFLLFADDHGGTPNDPSFHQLWGLNNFGQTVNGIAGTPDADIDAREAWSVSTGSPSVVVAVIDTGVDLLHPDLTANVWVNQGENCAGCRTNGIDDDDNGYVDDWRGWDWVNGDGNPADDHGHGTHVAGTIAAVGNNALGVAGVTWSTKIMALKFLSAAGTGTTADAISAILYANAKGVPILNNSWGGDAFSQALLDAIEQTDANGALFVAAAGNSFANTDLSPHYPSGYEAANVIAVGASDATDRRSWFSNYGVRTVDVSAPGSNILSTWPSASYRSLDGTSMAAPHVAGSAALMKAVQADASGTGLKALLLRTVDQVSALGGASRTAGRLNVDRAARCLGEPKAWIESPAPGFEVDAGEPLAIRVLAASCASPAGVSVSATANGNPLELAARGDGLYAAAYAPAAGAVTISITAIAGDRTDTQGVSGTAIQNYEITPGGPSVTVTTQAAA